MFRVCIVLTVFRTILCESSILDTSVFPTLPVAVLKSENAKCETQSLHYVQSLKNFTLWAYEMWDATAKTPTGVLRGNTFQMGHFEQCTTADAPFLTQYCLATLKANIPKPSTERDPISLFHDPDEFILSKLYNYKDKSQQPRNVIQVGWCIPASCTPTDSEEFLNTYINELEMPLKAFNVTYSAKVSEITCHTKEDGKLDVGDIIFCILSAILVVLVITSTLYDLTRYQTKKKSEKPLKKSLPSKFFLFFSAKQNVRELNRMEDTNEALMILYGMRTICILCIVMDHRFGTFTSSALLNFDYVERQYRAPLAPFIFHGDLFVDSFFILSGLLVTYGLLGQFDKKKLNPGFIILMRYIRYLM